MQLWREALVAIRAVSRKEFDRFHPTRISVADLPIEEIEWFAEDDGIVIGVITRIAGDRDWSIAVLGRDTTRGPFRAFDADANCGKLETARRLLLAKMAMALASGRKVFPQEE
jgi:hypothetical protein